MTNYKAGDECTLSAIISSPSVDGFAGMVSVRLRSWDPDATALWVRGSDIATHTPKPRELEVGDVVGLEGAPEHFRWTVIGLHGEWAWLSSSEGAYASAKKIQIVRA